MYKRLELHNHTTESDAVFTCQELVDFMAADGVDTVVEIGPGKALSGFFKKTAPEIKTYHIDTAADFHSVVSALKGETA